MSFASINIIQGIMNKKEKAKRKAKKSPIKKLFSIIGIILGALIILAGGYLLYVTCVYSRIDDKVVLEVSSNEDFNDEGSFKTGQQYSIVTNNLGFGAYSQDYDFFMDGGKQSWAPSEDEVYTNLSSQLTRLLNFNPDILLLQEVDVKATRSYNIDEVAYLNNNFLSRFNYTFAYNYYKSPFFIVPVYQPHGTITSGLVTYSTHSIKDGLRRSLPIVDSFSKYFDLDRCYSISRLSVEGGKELVIFNVHLSAYCDDRSVREGQIKMLFDDMISEYNKGNYVIAGGDFNHDLRLAEGEEGYSAWARAFTRSAIPEHLGFAMDRFDRSFIDALPSSCRDVFEGYQKGHTPEFIVDGFIVSDNIEVNLFEILNEGYRYSDHEPVHMTFTLK